MVCLDPLTGRPHWMKSGIEPGTDMIGTAEHVYLFSPDDRRVLVHRTLDGKQISKLNVPEEMVNRYLQLGRQVVSSRTVGNQVTLSGFVLSPEGIRKTWDRAFARDSVAARFDASNIAVLAPDGSYQILDLVNGKSRSKVPLNSSVEAKSLSVVHFGDQYLLLVNRKSHVQVETRRYRGANDGRPEVSLDGEIHLMDSKGPLWQSPVRVDDFDFILNQPPTAPAFLLRKEEKDFAGTELVFVRRSDGASIEFGKNVPTDRPTTYFEVDSRKGFYTFNMGFHAFNLEFTRYPRPVEPPAQLGAFSNLPKPRTNKENRPKDLFLNSNDQFLRKATLLKNWADAEWAANPLKQIINND